MLITMMKTIETECREKQKKGNFIQRNTLKIYSRFRTSNPVGMKALVVYSENKMK